MGKYCFIILVILTMTDSLTEGGVDAWAALYMRDAIGVDGFQIGIATIFFNLFMVIGRLMGDLIRDKLGVYRFLISPLLGNNKCRYLPTCSEYFIESLKAHGIKKGSFSLFLSY